MAHLTYDQIQAMGDHTIGDAERRSLEEHLFSCKRCAREVALQESVARAIRQAPLVRPSRRFTKNVMDRILPGSQDSKIFRLLGGAGKILAMGLVLAVMAFALTRTWPGTTESTTAVQNQSQVTKVFLQYYAQAQQLLLAGSDKMGQTLTQQSTTPQSKILAMTILSFAGLALVDRYVLRRFLKMKL